MSGTAAAAASKSTDENTSELGLHENDDIGNDLESVWDDLAGDSPTGDDKAKPESEAKSTDEDDDAGDDVNAQGDDADDTPASDDDEDESGPASDDDDADEQATDLPHGWSKDHQDEWDKTPENVRAVIAAREKERDTALFEKTQQNAELNKVLEPLDSDLQLNGQTRATFVGSLVAAHQYLLKDPQAALQHIAKQYGVDVKGLTQQQGDDTDNESDLEDGQTSPAMQKLSKQMSEIQTSLKDRDTKEATDRAQQVTKMIDDFAAATDDKGNKLHPHFEVLRLQIGMKIREANQAGKELSLQDAYDAAAKEAAESFGVTYDESTGGKANGQGKANGKDTEEEKRKKAEAAKKAKAAASKRGKGQGTGTGKAQKLNANQDLTADLEDVWDKLST